ncbi:TIGR00266 family protein [Synechococcus sp. PCC 7336]|uniref:TIGR00266 family protein n=1 Tax=Synechococcus sp. PCC 7336 TaxID=195250 RepID=UPI00034C1A71|nr:TIGR00266 family protein [Synechococcus sp. PCC 7336]
MKYDIQYKPAFSTVFVTLDPGESIMAEAGAMASMDSALRVKAQWFGGIGSAFLKAFFGKESLFANTFTNPTALPLQVVLTQSTVGDISRLQLNGNSICLQPGAYIAHTTGVKVGVQWAGFASWIGGEGLFRLKLSGRGLVFFGAYGGLTHRRIDGEFIVDSGHLVAYDPGIRLSPKLAGGLLSSLTSGEGLVTRLRGRGSIYLQSRSTSGLLKFLRPKVNMTSGRRRRWW